MELHWSGSAKPGDDLALVGILLGSTLLRRLRSSTASVTTSLMSSETSYMFPFIELHCRLDTMVETVG